MGKKAKRVYDENGNVTHKVCGKCGELKGIDEFNVDKSASDGHQRKCKECLKKYREENKEQRKEYDEKRYKENKEQIKEYVKKYREENKEQIKEWKKKHYEENKEQIKERVKKYREENKEQIKEWKKKHYEESIARIKTIVEQDPTKYDYKIGEEIYGLIYLAHCKPTNKYYVGQTTVGFDNRYSGGFFNDSNHKTKDDLKEDLEKYGEDSFEFTKIFKVAHNKEELDNLEVYYIDYFNSYYDGYNETRGNHRVK